MDSTHNLNDRRIADAWATLQSHADSGNPLQADAYRLAFTDPEFLIRRETRGIRLQLEMLKPELDQQAQGIDNTVVVYGSARFLAPDEAQALPVRSYICHPMATMSICWPAVPNRRVPQKRMKSRCCSRSLKL